jgi:hypothetical protein
MEVRTMVDAFPFSSDFVQMRGWQVKFRAGTEREAGLALRRLAPHFSHPGSLGARTRPSGSCAVSRPLTALRSQSAASRSRLRDEGMWLK